jgi:hypothetical protein
VGFALTLNKIGKHDEATASFKEALELASNDPLIAILRFSKAYRDVEDVKRL